MKNESGVLPTEYKVLISVDALDSKTKGGIIIPEVTQERQQFAQMQGTLVAVSPWAFSYENWTGHEDAKPKPGDRVMFAKYSGADIDGKDGKKYRLINDKDVTAVLA